MTALVSSLMLRLWGSELDMGYLVMLRDLGPLAYFEGLLTLYGNEADMWSNMCIAIEDLSAVSFQLVQAQGEASLAPTPRITGSRQALEVQLPVPEHSLPGKGISISFKITPVFFNIGINEKASFAETLGQTREQHRSNWDNYLRLSQYFGRYRKLGLGSDDAGESLQSLLGERLQERQDTPCGRGRLPADGRAAVHLLKERQGSHRHGGDPGAVSSPGPRVPAARQAPALRAQYDAK
uniref:Type I inositol 3,4-bisphosphate 4-phosphatase-like n=1 Tax=Drosophila rhopaloa TaxID=1041015 RepID=A0A6P4EE07_DRORH